MARRRTNRTRDYQRSDRLNELLREVIAEELEAIDNIELGLVSVSAVQVDNELTKARVFLSTLDGDPEEIVEKVTMHKGQIRKAIANQARLRRVPELVFAIDPAIESGGRIDEILSQLAEKKNRDPNDTNES